MPRAGSDCFLQPNDPNYCLDKRVENEGPAGRFHLGKLGGNRFFGSAGQGKNSRSFGAPPFVIVGSGKEKVDRLSDRSPINQRNNELGFPARPAGATNLTDYINDPNEWLSLWRQVPNFCHDVCLIRL
ncbi:hypothetical protein M513_10734 [Trichuris suis]|uniref:Uncharacterized protein n=1 Tax=Trichuris suis TaxID=68888 RepID=A0A085LTT6_9BILA|nr:hypothetical protein M513_10734 [Trichuris suis]